MAKRKKLAKKSGGPFLAAAVFCESIMEDANKMMSAIKILDGIQLWISPDAPAEMPSATQPVPLLQNILLIIRTGDSPGKHDLRLITEGPSGKRVEVLKKEVELSAAPHGGVNVKTHANIHLSSSGLYWIDVILDGKRLTRMPLNVSIQRLPTTDSATPKKKRV